MTTYQIALFSIHADAEIAALRETLKTRLDQLGVDPAAISFLDESSSNLRDRKAPTVAAVVSTIENPDSINAIIDLLQDNLMVVPVVRDISRYKEFVFKELEPIAGMPLSQDDTHLEEVASVLLEGLNLLRRSRRLFISYRRSETRGVAIQLYETLEAHGFDVFLDTHSVRPGEPFQEVLWHRLADTDVVVLLDSPGFINNHWTAAELAQANSTNIQILQLVWPESEQEATAAFNRSLKLGETDFTEGLTLGDAARLAPDILMGITAEVESLRARALAARYAYLTQEFCGEASSLGLAPIVQPQRFVSIELRSKSVVAIVPTIGVPDATRYHEIEETLDKTSTDHKAIMLLYDERGIRNKWLQHIGWLDRQELRVQSLPVARAATWLRGLQ